MAHAVRVICDFNGRLTPSAELALADWVLGITLQLFCEAHFGYAQLAIANYFGISFHQSHRQTAAGRAERANAGFPNSNSRYEAVFWNKSNEVIFGISTAGECRAGARKCGEFYESATVHINSDKSGSHSTRPFVYDN